MVQKNCIERDKIIIITGATAIGKTALSIKAAQEFDGEIISVDSMQVFRGLDIGTGKITDSEKCGVPHHLIDIKDPDEEYSVSEFVCDAKQAINEIVSRGRLPILVGGTGLYINALLNTYNFADAPKSEEIRLRLNEEARQFGSEALYGKLFKIDRAAAEKISKNDTKRIIRALEIFELTGCTKSVSITNELNTEFDYKLFVLNDERSNIYQNINDRVDKMMDLGLLNEVKSLYRFKDYQSMQAIGYKEIISFLDGNCELTAAIDSIKQNTRRYAKRQLTYFRWMKLDKIWVLKTDTDKIIGEIADFK